MSLIDYIIIGVYLAFIFGIAILCSFGHRSLAGYFLGGRNVPWWAAACSGIAAMVSGIAYLGAPGLAFTHNYTYHLTRLGVPLALLVICLVMLPILFRLNICSIYEYLERRFDKRVRLLASALFLLSKCCYLAIVIYAPSLVVSRAFNLPLPVVTISTGMIVAVYTMMGGIKAVIWTDTLQLGIFVSGIIATLAIVISRVPGGLGEIIQVADAAGRLQIIDWSFNFTDTYTVWGGLIGGSFILISQFGSNQAEIQRFLTTKSVKQANWAMSSSMLLSMVVGISLFFIGTTLFGFYHAFPEKGGLATDPNQIFAKFIIEEMPHGLKGLLIAAVLAASMSVISVMLNSLTTVTSVDIIPQFTKRPSTIRMARVTTLCYGLVITTIACFGAHFGNILEASMRVIGLFLGTMTGVFLIGMLSRRVTAKPALVGMAAGVTTVCILQFGFPEISFLWHSPASAIATMLVSWLLSLGTSPEKINEVPANLIYQRGPKTTEG